MRHWEQMLPLCSFWNKMSLTHKFNTVARLQSYGAPTANHGQFKCFLFHICSRSWMVFSNYCEPRMLLFHLLTFLSSSIHPFIHYAFMEVGTCALVTAGVRQQLMTFTKLALSSTLFLRWNLNYQAWRQSTLTHHTDPQNLFLTRFCLYFDFGDYKYSGEYMRSLVWGQALQDP